MEARLLKTAETRSLEEVAELLRQCFRPPHVGYEPDGWRLTAEMLAWQLAYPSSLGPRLITLSDRRVLGCLALWPRRVSFRGHAEEIFVLTLVAVSPDARRSGLGRRLYETAQEEAGLTPLMAFVEAGGPGEALLVSSLGQRSGSLVSLGSYRSLMAVATPGDGVRSSWEWQGAPPDVETVCPDADAIVPAASSFQMSHYSQYPFSSGWFVARDGEGRPKCAALVSLPGVASDQGWATLELVVGSDWDLGPRLDDLARRVGGKVGRRIVLVVPNNRLMTPRSSTARIREAGPEFHGYLSASSTQGPFAGATFTLGERL